MRPIRNSAKAIVIRDGRLLAVQIRDDEVGDFYVLPGGGQEPGESLHDALQRECLEEIGTRVSIGDLRFVRDYIGRNHDFAAKDIDLHAVEFLFHCEIDEDIPLAEGSSPDTGQIGLAWLDLNRLDEHGFYPAELRPFLRNGLTTGGVVYLGDIA